MPTTDFVSGGSGFAGGAVGDGQRQTVNASITSGTKNLAVDTAIFASGDVGKAILLTAPSFFYLTTISTFTDSTHVVLAANAPSTLSSVSTDILWGADNTTAFTNFNTWAIAQSGLVTLTCPAGRFCTQMDNSRRPFRNIRSVKFQGAGITSTIISQLQSGQLYFGGSDPVVHKSLTDAGGNSARIYTAYRGATSIRLKDISYASRFAANRYIKLTGFDMQGLNASAFGYPPNPFFYEDAYVTSIASDILTLAAPLTNTYLDTWPNWNSGSAGEADPGGPATIYAPDTSYNTEVELNDFTIDNPYYQSVAHGRRVVMNRVLNTGVAGIYPTQNGYFEANNVDWSGVDVEVDKINGEVVFNNCAFRILRFQSASPNVCTINGGTTQQLVGSPKRLIINGLTFTNTANLQLGPTSYGRTDEVQINDCIGINTFSYAAANMTGLHGGGASATLPITNGIISFAKTQNNGASGEQNQTRVFVPGTWLLGDNKFIFRVLDVYEDGTNVYIKTNLTGGWPLTFTFVQVHPAPIFTMRNCTGAATEVADYNGAPAGIPLYSYTKRTYIGGPTSATHVATTPTIWGRLVTAKFNVTTPYIAAGALTFNDGQFTQRPYIKLSDYSGTNNFGATVNMKIAGSGPRIIPAASAPTGGQTGDSLFDTSSTGQIWFYGVAQGFPIWSANVSNGETPTVTVEYVTDQGFPPPITVSNINTSRHYPHHGGH